MEEYLIDQSKHEPKVNVPLDPKLEQLKEMGIEPTPADKEKEFGPLSTLSENEEMECIKKACKKVNNEHNRELELMKSSVQLPDQKYCVCSFVSPNSNQKTELCGIKIFGAFESMQKAKKWAKHVNSTEENKLYDVYVLEMYSWCLIPPDPDKVSDSQYRDNTLDDLIRKYKAEKYKHQEVFDLRKQKLQHQKNTMSAEELKNMSMNKDFIDYLKDNSSKNKSSNPNPTNPTNSNLNNNDPFRQLIHPQEKLPPLTLEKK